MTEAVQSVAAWRGTEPDILVIYSPAFDPAQDAHVTPDSDRRRDHLAHVCRMLATYIEDGHPVRMKTVHDEESLAELAKEIGGRPAIVFTVEDWEAFRELLEPGSPRD